MKRKPGDPPILFAPIRDKDIKRLEALISRGTDKDDADSGGWTPLTFSCFWGTWEATAVLVKAGADTEKADSSGVTPLMMACTKGHVECVRILLDAAANVEARDRNGFAAIHNAVLRNCTRIVELLITAGANVNSTLRTPEAETPLLLALSNHQSPECAKVIASAGGTLPRGHLMRSNDPMRFVLLPIVTRPCVTFLWGLHARLGESSPAQLLVGFPNITQFIVAHSVPSWIVRYPLPVLF